MSETVRDAAPVPAPSPPAPARDRTAGAVLLRGGPFAGLAVGVVVVSGAVLVPVGLWRPGIALPVMIVGVALVWRLCRLIPVRPVPFWVTGLAVLVAAGEGLWAAATHAEHLILRRDSGSYALYAQWIATQHGLPVDGNLDAFGGGAALAVPGFTLGSPAYFQVAHGAGADVVPQFLVGAPALYSLGWWAGGWSGLLLMPALAAAFGVFGVAALSARLVGPRWAPLAAGSLALAFPVLFTARSTYSEPFALVLVATAATLIADATVAASSRWTLGLAGGLALGVAGLVRVDVLTEVALLVPVIAVLALRRHRAAGGIALGLLAGTVAAATSAVLTSAPYLETIKESLIPLAVATAVLALVSAGMVVVGRRRSRRHGEPQAGESRAGEPEGGPGPDPGGSAVGGPGADGDGVRPRRWAVRAGWLTYGLVLLLGVLLASRPLWQTVRALDGSGAAFVAGLQRTQGLSIDGARTYAEWSLMWVAWWLGPVLVVAAWLTVTALSRRAVVWLLSGPDDAPGTAPAVWLAPLAVGVASSVLTLWRPGITPDHPWADRRLVPVLLPTFVIAGTAAVAWVVRQVRRRFTGPVLVLLTATGLVVLLAQPLIATAPLATDRTEQGELGAVRALCAALAPGDVVLAVDNRGFNEWPQVVRGVCGHPAATLQDEGVAVPDAQLRASATRLAELVRAQGGRLVLLASGEDRAPDQVFTQLGLIPRQVVRLSTTEDPRKLASPPLRDTRLEITVWLAPWDLTGT